MLKKQKTIYSYLITLISIIGLSILFFLLSHSPIKARADAITVGNLTDLQTALTSANSSTTIIVSAAISLPDETTLNGNGATVRVENTFLSEIGTINSSADAYGVFTIADSASVTINNMIIMGGAPSGYYNGDPNTTGSLYDDNNTFAAVIVGSSAYLKMEGVTITRSFRGISCNNNSSKLEFVNCYIGRNAATRGAGIFTRSGIVLDGCSISENRCLYYDSPTAGTNGGGISISKYYGDNNDISAYFNNTVVVNNSCTGQGGGINLTDADLYLINCTITGNTATNSTENKGAGIGTSDGCSIYAANCIIKHNYRVDASGTAVCDLANSSYSRTYFYAYNCIFGTKNNINTDYIDTTYDKAYEAEVICAASYRSTGAINYNGVYSTAFSHPATPTKTAGIPALYVPVKSGGAATSGGCKTYFDYSNFKSGGTVGIGAYYSGGIQTWKTGFDSNDQVTTYFEGTARTEGVIGASAPSTNTYYTITLSAPSNGSTTGGTIYGDTYLSGTEVTTTATPNVNYIFKNWSLTGAGQSSNNPYTFEVTQEATLTANFSQPVTIYVTAENKTITYNDEIPSYSYTSTINSQQVSDSDLLYSINNQLGGLTSTYVQGSNVGSYTINPTNSDTYDDVFEFYGTDYVINYTSATLTVEKADPVVSDVSGKSGLIYTGAAQELITAGTTSFGTLQYKIDDGVYSTSVPEATNIGTYTVYYKVEGDQNHNDLIDIYIGDITIDKITPTLTAPTAKELVYTGLEQALVNAGSTTGGTLKYSLDNSTFDTSVPNGTNADTYTVYYKVVGDEYYKDIDVASIEVTIAKANATLISAPTIIENLSYTGEAQVLINAGSATGGILNYKIGNNDYSTDLPGAINAGTYTVYYKVIGDQNHNDTAEATLEVTIAKANATIIAPTIIENLSYTGEEQALVNAGTATGGTLQYKLGTGEYSTSIPKGTNAGSYTVYYKVVGDSNHNDIAEESLVVPIAKINSTLTVPTAKELTYSGSAQELVNAGSAIGGTLQYKLGDGEYGVDLPSSTNAGTYTIYYKVVGDSNHNDIAEANLSTTIAKATPQVTAPVAASSLVYTGEELALVSAGSTTGGTLQYSLDNSTFNTSIPKGTNAGSYTVYYKVVGNSNYNDVVVASLENTISKADTTLTAPTAKELTYSGLAQALVNAGTPVGGTIQYKLGNGEYGANIPTSTNAGSYTVYYKVIGDSNHNDIAEASVIATISKAALIITADDISISYNDEAPTYTVNYSGFVNNEDKSVLGGALAFECAYEVGSNVSEYAITPSGNTSDNYEISYVAGTLTVNKINPVVTAPTEKELTYSGEAQALINAGSASGGTLSYKLGNGEYGAGIPEGTNAGSYTVYYKVVGDSNHNDIAEASLEVSIAKADATLTAPTAKELTYSGEAQALVNAGTPVGGTLQYKLDDGEYGNNIPTSTNAGSYTVYYKVVGDTNHNDIAEASLVVSIAKADATLTAPTAKELTYSGDAQALVNAGTPVGGTIQYKLGDGEYSENIPTATNAGSYTVYYKVVGDTNHNDTESANVQVTIAKANATLTAPTAKELTYSGDAQELINAGSATGGTLSYKLGTGDYATSIPGGTNAGSYTVYYKVTGDTNHNDIAEANLVVSIAKASLTITADDISISYNDEAPTYTVNYSGFVNNEDKSVLGGTLVFECVYEVGSNVSEYAITPSGNTSDNYEISYVSGTLTVNKIDSTLTAPTVLSNLVYTGSVQELVTAGSVTGGTLQYKLDNGGYVTDVPGATNAGTYTVYFKVVGDENHNDIAEASLEVSIAKADATLTAPTAKELTYSGEAQALINAGTPVGGTIQYKLGDGEYSENIPTATNAGSYTVYYKVTGDANHNDIAEASLDESIAKADSSITAPTIKDDLVFSGAKQELINAGSAVGGELQYSIDDNNYGTDIPKGLSAGTYTVYYKVVGDSNHKDIAAQSIEITIDKKEVEIIWSANDYTYNGSTQEVIASYKDVSDESVSLNVTIDNEFKNAGNYIATASFANNESNYKLPSVVTKEYSIAKATPEYIIPEGLTVITDNKLSAVSLPEGFAWNNPEQNVGSEEGSKTFKASFTPSDTTNYLVVEDIDITVAITAQWSVEDPAVEEVKAEIKGIDEVSHDIHLKVEVKVETSDNQSVVEVEKPEAIEGMIEKDEKIAVVFDVKLIRKVTVNGVETTTEIQPSDIKEGATIEIEMAIPENLLNESFRILHIHNDGTVKEMEYTRSDDQKSVIVTTDKLSEFAFVIKNNSSSPLVWSLIIVSFIVIILATAFLLLLFVFNKWIIADGEITRAFIIKKNDNEAKLITRYLRIETRLLCEVYNTKEDAVSSLSKE